VISPASHQIAQALRSGCRCYAGRTERRPRGYGESWFYLIWLTPVASAGEIRMAQSGTKGVHTSTDGVTDGVTVKIFT